MKIKKIFQIKSRHSCYSKDCNGNLRSHILRLVKHGNKIGLYYICSSCDEATYYGQGIKKNFESLLKCKAHNKLNIYCVECLDNRIRNAKKNYECLP